MSGAREDSKVNATNDDKDNKINADNNDNDVGKDKDGNKNKVEEEQKSKMQGPEQKSIQDEYNFHTCDKTPQKIKNHIFRHNLPIPKKPICDNSELFRYIANLPGMRITMEYK